MHFASLYYVVVGARLLSLLSLLIQAAVAAPPVPVDEARAAAAGIRSVAGRHLVFYTDLPSRPDVDALPAAFDLAVPQWAAYFGVEPAATASWRVRAFLIGERAPFEALGLMPAGHEEFPHGLAVGSDLWLYDQPTAYYRRHLLLHEGTHAFMTKFLGGCGPGWYMEGTAELLATHQMKKGSGVFSPSGQAAAAEKRVRTLFLNVMPGDRREVPMLGRIKLVRDAFAEGRALALPAVMEVDNRRQLGTDAYAWTWAAAKFLDAHPRYRDRFRELKQHVTDQQFNDIVRREYAADWTELLIEWQAFVATLDYGYDFERMAIRFEPGTPLVRGRREATIAADRGWQSSGVWLEAGHTYRIRARGRYQITAEATADGARTVPCEPGGITLEYHDGRPLGILLGAIVDETRDAPVRRATLVHPIPIGLGRNVTPQTSGTLYLRVNDSAGRLGDNRGVLTIEIEG